MTQPLNLHPRREGRRTDDRLFRLFVDSAQDVAIFMLDADGNIMSWNRGARRLTGFTAHDVIGRDMSVIYLEAARRRRDPAQDLRVAAEQGRFEGDDWRVRKNGPRFWAHVILTAMHDETGKLLGFAKITRDITQQRRAEHALRASRERFRFLFQNNPTMYFTVDPAGTILSVNDYGAKHLGYSVAELTGRPVGDTIAPPERAVIRARIEVCRRSPGEVCSWRTQKLRKDGATMWVRESVRPIRKADGSIMLLVACTDVDAVITAEDERERLLTHQHFLAEASQALAGSMDYETTLAHVARLAVPMLADICVVHVRERDGPFRRVASPLEPNDTPERQSSLAHAMETRQPQAAHDDWRDSLVVPLIARGHVLGAVEFLARGTGDPHAPPKFDEATITLAEGLAQRGAVAIDNARLYEEANRRVGAELALRDAVGAVATKLTTHEALQQIAESSTRSTEADGAFVTWVHTETREVEVAAVAGGISTPIGKTGSYDDSYTKRVTELDRPVVVDRLNELIGPLRGGELARRYPDWKTLIVPLDTEQPSGALFLLRKPESRPFTEDEMARAYSYAKLASLTFRKLRLLEESERRREELVRVSESRARLTRGFSHDVKNPLGVADSHAQLLLEGVFGALTDKQQESVRGIRKSVKASLRLIQDLLELARAEAGQITLDLQSVDVAAVAREVAEDFRAKATSAGLTLDVRVDEPMIVNTDAARVRQILGNLVSNAVKYTPKGIVTVSGVAHARKPIPGGGEWVILRVADTGPGIPQDQQERIFQEFTRLGDGEKPGAGVGLAISKRIAGLLGGDITVESFDGRGASFALWLPTR